MKIKYVTLSPGVVVSVGTNQVFTITGYDADKHGNDIDGHILANGDLHLKVLTGSNRGDIIEVPRHSIASIRFAAEPEAKPAQKVAGK